MTTRKPSATPTETPSLRIAQPAADPHPLDPFVFDLYSPRPKVSEQKMLESLKAYSRIVRGRPFTQKEFNAWPKRAALGSTIARHFGTWWKALRAAGVKPVRNGKWDAQDLMDLLERLWRQLGHRPSAAEVNRTGEVTQGAYFARWGGVLRACERLAQFKAGHITKEELLTPDAAPKRKPLPPSLRWQIIERDHYHCTACGTPAQPKNRLEVDHIQPVSQGGTNDPTNLRTLCQRCNQGRGDNRRKSAA